MPVNACHGMERRNISVANIMANITLEALVLPVSLRVLELYDIDWEDSFVSPDI